MQVRITSGFPPVLTSPLNHQTNTNWVPTWAFAWHKKKMNSTHAHTLLNPLMDLTTWYETLCVLFRSSFNFLNNSSFEKWPGTSGGGSFSSFQTLWSTAACRCISKYDLTCAFFVPAEVQDLSRALTHSLSSTHIILSTGCDPCNVIQMSCIMRPTAWYKRRAFGLWALSESSL